MDEFSGAITRRAALTALAVSQTLAGQESKRPIPLDDVAKTLPAFGRRSHQRLVELLNAAGFRGQLPAVETAQIAAQERKSLDQMMTELLPLAQVFARPPISNFKVGAVARGVSGALYLGANLEVPANVLGMTVHAEQSATCNAFMGGDSGIAAMAVTAAPCGHCRQFLYEFAGGRDIRIFVKGARPTQLSALLPAPFGPKDLGLSEHPFAHGSNPLALGAGASDELAAAALEAAKRSYAPYSKSPSGVAVRSRTGRVYTGAYLENAAFNPSLSPLQIALVGMAIANEPFAAITRAGLVELQNASISQTSAARAVLQALAPNATLETILARPA